MSFLSHGSVEWKPFQKSNYKNVKEKVSCEKREGQLNQEGY
jgi:hypothetical protein